MADSILTLVLRLRKQGANVVNEVADDIKRVSKGMADVKASFDVASQAAEVVGQAIQATIGAAAEWGDSMGDLAQLTGTSVREASELAATLELLGIKQDGLTKVVKAFTAQGLQPTMANIRALAAEYQAIQDPVSKNEFLFKRFGKQAADVAEVFGKSAEELDAFTAAARRSGKVIDEEMADQAERLNVQIAILQQRVEGAGISIGNLFIPTLNQAITAGEQLFAIWQMGNVRLRELRGEIDGATAAMEMQRIAGIEPATEAAEAMTDATEAQARSAASLSAETARWAGIAAEAAADAALRERLDELTGAASDLQFGMQELTRELIFNQAAAGLDEQAAYDLAKSMGLIKPAAAAAKDILDELRDEYDNGAITIGEYQGRVKLLANAIDALPEGKTITITYLEQYVREFNSDFRRDDKRIGGAIGDGAEERASGGPVIGGMPYIVGERGPELFVPRSSGEIIPHGASGLDVTLRAMISTLPTTIARAVRDGMMQAAAR